MRRFDLIAIGTGSVMSTVVWALRRNPSLRVAVIDKDEPGGICLTRGCIPSKILLYPAELIRLAERMHEFGVKVRIESIDFAYVMRRMRALIGEEIEAIRKGLSSSENIAYYRAVASFIAPYTLQVDGETISAPTIFLGTGSRPYIPPIEGLEEAGYLTSDTVLGLERMPKSLAIIGGGYIAAEYGHFFSAMGARVTILGRNPRFLPDEEPEISEAARRELGRHMTILTAHEVVEARKSGEEKRLTAVDRKTGKTLEVSAEEVLVAAGRAPNSDLLRPERGGIEVDEEGWIKVNEYLETTQPNVWALGDATGRHMFKHKANYEAEILFYNAILGRRVKANYDAIPHAVFTYPEVASVGLREKEAVERYGEDALRIGYAAYEETAKGEAMNAKGYFVKVIVHRDTQKILGAHIIGPFASSLIQELVNAMYIPSATVRDVAAAMHIHPAMSEVVERACARLMTLHDYHHVLEHHLMMEQL
jgi:mycothione reductase